MPRLGYARGFHIIVERLRERLGLMASNLLIILRPVLRCDNEALIARTRVPRRPQAQSNEAGTISVNMSKHLRMSHGFDVIHAQPTSMRRLSQLMAAFNYPTVLPHELRHCRRQFTATTDSSESTVRATGSSTGCRSVMVSPSRIGRRCRQVGAGKQAGAPTAPRFPPVRRRPPPGRPSRS